MKLTGIHIHPEGASSDRTCELSFRDPQRAKPYAIKSVFGLDADEIVARYYGVAGSSSKKYFNLAMQKREVTIRIELNPSFENNESYSDLRDNLQKVIASTRTGVVRLRFKDGATTVAILRGFVTKFESALSTKTPEVQLTINCIEPMLKAPAATEVDLTGFDPGYTILDDQVSTAPHGFSFVMDFTGAVNTFIMEDPVDLSWKFQITPAGGFLPDDSLYFSSEPQNKYLYVERSDGRIHLADSLDFASVWPIMFPGPNNFTVSSSELMNWGSIQYFHTFWGI
jgi:hypothetical protein